MIFKHQDQYKKFFIIKKCLIISNAINHKIKCSTRRVINIGQVKKQRKDRKKT